MSEHILRTIDELKNDLHQQEAEVADTKRLINKLCARAGIQVMYPEPDAASTSGVSLSIRGDQFYGQPLATCMRAVLEMRRSLNQGPASVNELYASLEQGGYRFDTKDEQNAKRNLRISLQKNPIFHRLPQGTYGLVEWYPAIKRRGSNSEESTKPNAEPSASPETGNEEAP